MQRKTSLIRDGNYSILTDTNIKGRDTIFLTNPSLTKSTHSPNHSQSFLDTSFNNNKGLKFENYTTRKFQFNGQDGPGLVSYIEPTKYDFKKTVVKRRREKTDNINDLGKNNIPAANQYYPKFNYIQPPVKNGKIYNKEKILAIMYDTTPIKTNKYIISQLWHSTDVSTGYKTVKLKNVVNDFKDKL